MAFEFVSSVVAERKANGIFRSHHTLDPAPDGVTVKFQGKSYLNFSSNDYLGLAAPAEQLLPLASQFGLDAFTSALSGSTGSPLLTGHHQVHQYLEQQLADFTGYPAILLFSSGFAANQGCLTALMNNEKCIQYHDKLNHASLIDAGRSSQGIMKRFAHNDLSHLQRRVDSAQKDDVAHQLIVTEGVFSMDGDMANLSSLNRLAKQQKAWLYLDDAHGFGVLGENGAGSLCEQGLLPNDVDVYMANFGKAVSSYGAFIATSTAVADYFRQHCRHYVYSTAISPIQALITAINIHRLQNESWRQKLLKERISEFVALAAEYELPVLASKTAIQPIILGDSQRALAVSQYVKNEGFWVSAIRPPTVAINQARLRVSLSANHTTEQIRALVRSIRGALDSHDYQ